MDAEQRKFRTDDQKLKRMRVAACMTVKDVHAKTLLDRATIGKIMRGDATFLKTIGEFGQDVFDIEDPMELLHPEELAAMGVQTEVPSPGSILEWDIEQYLTGWQETSNGMQYQLARLSHRYLPARQARGKCYELRHLSGAERTRVEQYLLRHVEVCEQIGGHTNIASNVTAAPVQGVWWVIDQWEAGRTLQERIAEGTLSDFELRVVMAGLAEGLTALHRQGFLRRELSPQSIVLRETNDHPVMTDLELAKVKTGGPTVAPTAWPEDPYRALEVDGGANIDERADIYSWGRIFVHAATGTLPERGTEDVSEIDAPDVLLKLIAKTLSVAKSKRPQNFKGILKALRGWA